MTIVCRHIPGAARRLLKVLVDISPTRFPFLGRPHAIHQESSKARRILLPPLGPHTLAREHNPMRLSRACPAVRPRAIAEIKAWAAPLIVKGAIHGDGTRLWIELQHE